MAHREMDSHERHRIKDMLNSTISVYRIAAKIGRHRSTVYCEIKRNFSRMAICGRLCWRTPAGVFREKMLEEMT